MIKDDTVFILGAGASWHYGYPTGEKLVKKVIEKLSKLAEACQVTKKFNAPYSGEPPAFVKLFHEAGESQAPQIEAAWLNTANACEALAKRIKAVNPPVIDYYIAQQNDKSRTLGELAIAWVILDCERESNNKKGNINRMEDIEESPSRDEAIKGRYIDLSKYEDKWHRYILYQLSVGCEKSSDLKENKIHFVTFNYDISLEHHLYEGLTSNDLFEDVDIKSFLKQERFFHLYGAIKENPYTLPCEPVSSEMLSEIYNPVHLDSRHAEFKRAADYVYSASKGIKTIASGTAGKRTDEPTIKSAREKVANARRIYILGYGFDQNNNSLLELEKLKIRTDVNKESMRKIMFTNYNDINVVNKVASKIFHPSRGTPHFIDNYLLNQVPATGLTDSFEKSKRDVYEALSKDFDFLNE